MKLSFNHEANYNFLDIIEVVSSNEEYERLKAQIGRDFFHLDEYARLLDGLRKLVSQSQSKEVPVSCNIL